VPCSAKNPQIPGPADAGGPLAPPTVEVGGHERRGGTDRRDPARQGYAGPDRRLGPRRTADLPRPAWQRLLGPAVAIALGVAAALVFGDRAHQDARAEPTSATASIDPDVLAGVAALRDEAEALTLAGVALDERAHELWMPRVANIELALADPETPELIRRDLDAILAALERVGILAPEEG
jgi:hypothetical protein